MKKIVLTGGGTAGHVTPNIALMPTLRENGYDILYIGQENGMEKDLIGATGTPYKGISTGKFRRYFSLKNFTDPFRVIKGFFDALSILGKYKPDVIFSKGGFVSVPVVYAAFFRRIPIVIHESDMTPGLANKLSLPLASKICCNFPETAAHLPKEKAVVTGSPIRPELLQGSREKGLTFTGFNNGLPVLMIMGGSLGSVAVNKAVRNILPELLKEFQVVHLCGKNHLDESLQGTPGYVQYEYISQELPDLFAMADMVISRAGANAICEFQATGKPNVLIPLSAAASRGDQILNAASFKKQGFSEVIEEEELTDELLLNTIHKVYNNKEDYIQAMSSASSGNAIGTIVTMLNDLADKKRK